MTQCDYRAFYHDSPNKPRPAGLPYQIIFCQLDEGHAGSHEGIATLPDGTVWFRPSRAEFEGDRRNANRWDLEHGDESPMLVAALAMPGLAEFVKSEPTLDGTADLTPYLYLAQTALDPKRRSALLPQDELARDLADRMASDDALRARAAAKNATQQEPAVIAAIARLVAEKVAVLQADKEKRARVNALQSLETVCRVSAEHYRTVIDTLRVADVQDQGFAMVAVRVLGAAVEAGFQDASALRDQYQARSPLAKAGMRPTAPRRNT